MIDIMMLLQEAMTETEAVVAVAKNKYALLGAGIGLGLAVIGAGIGLGRIGGQTAPGCGWCAPGRRSCG